MNTPQMMVQTVESDERRWYQAGGLSAMMFGLAYLVIIALYVPLGAKPNGAEAWLSSKAGNAPAWWAILGLSVLTDFLLVPITLALYFTLRGINRSAMLAATAFVGLFVILDLALTWTNYAALITLGSHYAAATNDVQRALFVTAASYPSTVVDSNLLFIYNSLTLAVGILMTGLVMRRSSFGKTAAYVGVLTGALGIVAVASSFFASSVSTIAIILTSVLTTAWYLLIGYWLYKLGRP